MLRLLALYIMAIIFLSLNPWLRPDNGEAIGFITWDMAAHAAAYGVLSTLLILTFIQRGSALLMTTLVVLVSGLGGVFMEYCQYWLTETRQMSLHDAVANFMGALLGIGVYWGIRLMGDRSRTRIL